MNDRFKFRGMTLGGEWVYGNLAVINKKIKPYRITIDEGYYISNTVGMPFAYPVRPETIGQCTGLSDKNGNLIYEGDIIKYCVNWRNYVLTYTRIVAWDNDICSFVVLNSKTQVKPLQKWKFPDPNTHIIEIVGNIHENKGE